MPKTELTLEKVLQMIADDRDKYHLPVDISSRYTMRFIVDRQDIALLDAIPAEVKEHILDTFRRYESGAKLHMLSSQGMEDLTDEVSRFATLYNKQRG